MPVMDEFKEERDKIKNASFSEKLRYFWTYYKIHTIGALVALIFIVVLIHDITTQKENLFFAAILNCAELDTERTDSFAAEYAEFAEIDTSSGEILFDSSMTLEETPTSELGVAASQRMLVYTSSGELDVIVGGSDVFNDYANTDIFADLSEILSPEQLAKYEPYFYYVDMADIRDMQNSEEIYSVDYVPPTPKDPRKPEEMREPIPVGLFVTDCEKLSETYYFTGQDYTAVGVMLNTAHLENALKFIDYLFE